MRYLLIGVITVFIMTVSEQWYPRDNTDTIDIRSGMSLYTDYGTGCQYLSTFLGSLTPRLDVTGHHVGCYEL